MRTRPIGFLFGLLLVADLAVPAAAGRPAAKVTLGIDVLLTERVDLVRGKRVGLITNQSGVDGDLVATADRLAREKRVKLVQLYGPEHGIRGAAPAGWKIEDEVDPGTGLPVQSLFGKTLSPTQKSLSRLDALIFDIQDIGSRTYTYVTTMGKAMYAAKKAGIPFIVLDRPNPQGGLLYEGPVRLDRYKSFIGWGPLPVTHGMTVGELARFYNAELGIGADLHVVKMKGWKRSMVWQDTGLDWVQTSPGIPHALSAQLYVATGMIGGVTRNVNEGVGTTLPFEMIGAEFIEPNKLLKALNRAKLPGIRFRPITYRPYYFRFRGKLLHGVQLVPYDMTTYRPLRTALTILTTLEKLYPRKVRHSKKRFAITWGNKTVLKMIRKRKAAKAIEASWADELSHFALRRSKYLLY